MEAEMNIGIMVVEKSFWLRLAEILINLSDSIPALQAAKAVKPQEKEKRGAKTVSKKTSAQPPKKSKTPKPKTEKPKASKPRAAKKISVPMADEKPSKKEETREEINAKVESAFMPLKPAEAQEEPKRDLPPVRTEGLPRQVKTAGTSTAYSSSFESDRKRNNQRMWSFITMALLVVVVGAFGINYLLNRPPAAAPLIVPESSATPLAPTSTPVPFTATPQPTETPAPTETPLPTETPVVTPTLGISSTVLGSDGMILLYVPAGEFTMGSEVRAEEGPLHQVTISAFWIDQTEVTNAMYAKCVKANQCRPPRVTSSNTRENYYYNPEFANYPVISVSWNDANTYCSWVGRKLPTEAEWEKAARGIDGRIYPWGDDEPDGTLLNLDIADTTQAGAFPGGVSIYGALDMAGNVWEWVSDWYGAAYYQDSPATDPLGPEAGELRVLRGGSWGSPGDGFYSALRYKNGPRFNNLQIGFRCAIGTAP
jgi:formylglycine-generating enzyme required for sulfatase activity